MAAAQGNATLTLEQLQAAVLALQAENEALKQKQAAKQTVTVKCNLLGDGDAKGNISVYGLGRFPVTLYAGQWQKLAEKMPDILAAIEANKEKLAWK